MNISKNKYFAGTVLATQSISTLASNCSLAKQFNLSIKNYVIEEGKNLEDCKSNMTAGDSLKITFKNSKGQPLSKEKAKKCIEKLVMKLGPCFLVFYNSEEYIKGNLIGEKEEETITLKIKCLGDFSDLVTNLLEKYNNISTLEEFQKFWTYYDSTFKGTHLSKALETYKGRLDLICFLISDNLIDMSYTREKLITVEGRIATIYSVVEEIQDKNLKKVLLDFINATKFYKTIIYTSITKTGEDILEGNKDNALTEKFKVPNDPRSFDLIKYILTMEEIKSFNIESSYKFLLEKFILYMFTSKSKIAGNSNDLVEKKPCEKSWKANKEKELFDIWLSLKDRKDTVSVAALKLIKFLKKYLKEDELQTIKDKFLNGKIDAKFKEVFEKNEVEEDLKENNDDNCTIM